MHLYLNIQQVGLVTRVNIVLPENAIVHYTFI